jgi:hypothetical protein
VRDGGQDRRLEVGEQPRVRLAPLRGLRRQRLDEIPGLDLREHGVALAVLEVVGDPVDQVMAGPAEFVLRHYFLWLAM